MEIAVCRTGDKTLKEGLYTDDQKWVPNSDQDFCKDMMYETMLTWTKPTSLTLSTPEKTGVPKNPLQKQKAIQNKWEVSQWVEKNSVATVLHSGSSKGKFLEGYVVFLILSFLRKIATVV